jgi:hypothetical protein
MSRLGRRVIAIERFLCNTCDEVLLAADRKTPAPRCETCNGHLVRVAARGPGPGRGGRPPVDHPQSVTLGVRVTEDVAAQIDLYRGDLSRSSWLRQAIAETLLALEELGPDVAMTVDT